MPEVNQHLECLVDNLVGASAGNVGNHSNTARIVFQLGNVQTAFGDVSEIWQHRFGSSVKIVPGFGHVFPICVDMLVRAGTLALPALEVPVSGQFVIGHCAAELLPFKPLVLKEVVHDGFAKRLF